MNINFEEWTDEQLRSAEEYAGRSKHGPELLAEIQRRKDAGIWGTDGSRERVEALKAHLTRPRNSPTGGSR